MSDYTPTTGDVRARYVRDHGAHFVSDWAEFDRWLAEVIRKAKEEAWDEGWVSETFVWNPYREAERLAAFEKATSEDYTQGETE